MAGNYPEIEALTIGNIAEAMRCSRGHVRNLIKTGELPAYKSGDTFRVLLSDYLAYLERMKAEFRLRIEENEKKMKKGNG